MMNSKKNVKTTNYISITQHQIGDLQSQTQTCLISFNCKKESIFQKPNLWVVHINKTMKENWS